MTAIAVSQGSFRVERHLAASPARVFQAWSQPEQLALWAAPAEGWAFVIKGFEFRVGGGATFEFGPPGEAPNVDQTRYDDIIHNRRIVTAYAISRGETRISSSVSCLEFLEVEEGTLLRVIETGVFLDGRETALIREGGVRQQMAQLAQFIAGR